MGILKNPSEQASEILSLNYSEKDRGVSVSLRLGNRTERVTFGKRKRRLDARDIRDLSHLHRFIIISTCKNGTSRSRELNYVVCYRSHNSLPVSERGHYCILQFSPHIENGH